MTANLALLLGWRDVDKLENLQREIKMIRMLSYIKY